MRWERRRAPTGPEGARTIEHKGGDGARVGPKPLSETTSVPSSKGFDVALAEDDRSRNPPD